MGCTDPPATNFNPNANTDDGSCTFPSQDINSCAEAQYLELADTTYSYFSNYGAGVTEVDSDEDGVTDYIEPNLSADCVFIIDQELQHTVFFTIVGDGQTWQISTHDDCLPAGIMPLSDTQMAIMEGDCDGNFLVDCNDDTNDFHASITFSTQQGLSYYIMIDGWSGLQGDFCLNFESIIEGCTDPNALNYDPTAVLDDDTCAYPPPNDECADAIPIDLNDTNISMTNINATASETTVPDSCFWENDAYQTSVYYSFTGDGMPYTFTTSINCLDGGMPLSDTQFALFEGHCENMIDCNDDIDEVNGDWFSTITFATQVDVEYYLLVDGWGGLQGDFCLDILQEIPGCTDTTALNYNLTATFEDGSCQYEPVCNSSARFSNDNTRLIVRNFTTFADDAFIRNFLTAERTYIRYQYEIHRILESDDAKYQQVNEDFDAIREVALSILFQSFIGKQSIQITDEHLQLIERFLTSLNNATNKGKLKQEITEARRYLSVMKGKEIKDALIAYDRASSGGFTDFSPNSNEQLQAEFMANIHYTIGRNSQLIINLPTDGTVLVNIHNTNGQSIQSHPENLYNKGQHTINLDKSNLPPGMYFIHINYVDDTGKSIQKVLKMPTLY